MEEEGVARALSEPTVKQVTSPPEPVAAPSVVTGQRLSQDTEQASRAPTEAQESSEVPKPAPAEEKKTSSAPLATSKLDKPVAQREKETAAAEKPQQVSSESAEDDITAYSQYLDSDLGRSGSSEKEPAPTSPLAGRAMQVPKEPSASEQQAPPQQSPEEKPMQEEAVNP
jgi:hypothetical protein